MDGETPTIKKVLSYVCIHKSLSIPFVTMLSAMFHIENHSPHKRVSVPYECCNIIYVPTLLLPSDSSKHTVFKVGYERNAMHIPFSWLIPHHVTSSILLIPR